MAHPELKTAAPRNYVDPAHYEREVAVVFRHGWIAVARCDQLASPGDYLTLDLFGEPLVAVRGDDGAIRVLSRVCRHRWMPVVADGHGNRRSFQCPYHLWTYALDGRLVGAPDMERTPGFDRGQCRLPSLRVETWMGWVFASFDPDAEPLAPQLTGLERAIAPYRPEALRTLEPLVFEHEWNWKALRDDARPRCIAARGVRGRRRVPAAPVHRAARLDALVSHRARRGRSDPLVHPSVRAGRGAMAAST
jgi:phenylpropionate dioxygenase-like ring-hydroxylating dioxygenase large terminal subunit